MARPAGWRLAEAGVRWPAILPFRGTAPCLLRAESGGRGRDERRVLWQAALGSGRGRFAPGRRVSTLAQIRLVDCLRGAGCEFVSGEFAEESLYGMEGRA